MERPLNVVEIIIIVALYRRTIRVFRNGEKTSGTRGGGRVEVVRVVRGLREKDSLRDQVHREQNRADARGVFSMSPRRHRRRDDDDDKGKRGRRKRTAAAPVSTGETRSTESGGSARRAVAEEDAVVVAFGARDAHGGAHRVDRDRSSVGYGGKI